MPQKERRTWWVFEIFPLLVHSTIHCGTPLESPHWGDSNRCHNVKLKTKNVSNLHQIFFIIWSRVVSWLPKLKCTNMSFSLNSEILIPQILQYIVDFVYRGCNDIETMHFILSNILTRCCLSLNIWNTPIFFVGKMWEAFAVQKSLSYFQPKISDELVKVVMLWTTGPRALN